MAERPSISRRRLLELGGVAGTVALAGCPGGGEDETTPGATDAPDGEDGSGRPAEATGMRPIVFVHGTSGSATQFESNAMRFASNGYPDEYLTAYEYDTSVELEENEDEVHAGLDEHVETVLAETDAEYVDVVGHSRGTQVMHGYLDSADRAGHIANYVNVDGQPSEEPPGDRRTLAIWADYGIGGLGPLQIGGDAENVAFAQTHVEVATSRGAFEAIYEFLTGEEPETTRIEPEDPADVTLSGRVALFPQNEPVTEATLAVYEIDPETAERRTEDPHATPDLAADGTWGPIDVDGEARYEFVLEREGAATHHFYRQPALRSNRFVRLLTSEPGEGVAAQIDTGPDHAAITVSRDKEFWGDADPTDSLTVDGTELVNEATAPREDWIVAPMIYDAGSDGETDVSEPQEAFADTPFLTGLDVHLPAASPPDDVIEIESTPRDGDGLVRTQPVRNWASDEHRISVHLPDHVQQR